MIELNKKDIVYLNKIKEKIVRTHKKCNGRGYIFEKETVTCECMKILSYLIDLRKSNIPMNYWNLNLNDLKINSGYISQVNHYIQHLDNAIDQGVGLFFSCNTRGVGKTSLACEIGKAAIKKRYYVYYDLMQNIVSDKFTNSQEIIKKIKESELVIIDELDKVAMKKESNLSIQIENFLRDILPTGKTIIMCSNMDLKEIEEKMEISSLIKRYIKIIEMEGKDYSEQKNSNLDNLLTTEFDYFSENMINSAKEHYSNQKIAEKKTISRNI